MWRYHYGGGAPHEVLGYFARMSAMKSSIAVLYCSRVVDSAGLEILGGAGESGALLVRQIAKLYCGFAAVLTSSSLRKAAVMTTMVSVRVMTSILHGSAVAATPNHDVAGH